MNQRGPEARATRANAAVPSNDAVRRLRPSRCPPARDTDPTAFARILSDLLTRLPGAFATALVDLGGETVDYAGVGDPFDVKVAAAHVRILLNDLEELGALGVPRWIIIRGARRSFVGRRLPEGYALVVLLRRRAGFTASERAFSACEHALAREAGWSAAGAGPAWFPISVKVDARGRPRLVGAPPLEVEVFGTMMGLPRGERGFRVRTSKGTELTVVREAGHAWYADEDLEALEPSSQPA